MDTKKNKPVRLHDLMDFNQAFHAYDRIDGANCQTVYPIIMTQREAAEAAVKKAGLNQIKEIQKSWFQNREQDYEMLQSRLEILKEAAEGSTKKG